MNFNRTRAEDRADSDTADEQSAPTTTDGKKTTTDGKPTTTEQTASAGRSTTGRTTGPQRPVTPLGAPGSSTGATSRDVADADADDLDDDADTDTDDKTGIRSSRTGTSTSSDTDTDADLDADADADSDVKGLQGTSPDSATARTTADVSGTGTSTGTTAGTGKDADSDAKRLDTPAGTTARDRDADTKRARTDTVVPPKATTPSPAAGTASTAATRTNSSGTTATATSTSAATPAATSAATSGTGATPGASQDIDQLNRRMEQAVGGFVDDPKRAVREADAVLDEAVRRLTRMVEERRDALRGSWHADDSGDSDKTTGTETEELRVALTRYRDMTRELLNVN
ncbi:hypothetical protein GA0115240_150511 [Streptomyces sp. DvalAA-14]|uniref:hypothetical protein n=1 Tax=unclassified Streptomyces TaxID=2593676 RepID=UPI00081BC5EE|nr:MULTISPECIES: hypothetical protein [unclassified Streptomyces]MYS23271.1 hypothetical protein [Streptomyces sp. SID4948]SCE30487.1 hypothetical protein GA0115240_150511 [Streptomyces sp. DvalAA-14]